MFGFATGSLLLLTHTSVSAFCSKEILKLGTKGVKAVESHKQCEKHKAATKNHKQTPEISSFLLR